MSRIKNLVSSVSSGYLAMGANIVYTMGSIPVALHYLSKEQFGLWALISQLAGYLALLDFGMNASAARILIDHKDRRDGGRYGSILLTSGLVFVTQGVLIAAVGCLASPLLAGTVNISPQFIGVFRNLFSFQCILLGLGFLGRVFSAPLYAHQRYDICNLSQAVQLLIMFAALWIGFSLRLGLYSIVLSGLAGFFWSIFSQGIAVSRMGFFPKRGCWGHPDAGVFRELFLFGKDVFLMGLGWQLMSASQVVIISRVLGLDAAATWSICTKVFTLAQQFVWRIYDFSCGAFCEMLVRGENDRLKKRFKEIIGITASVSLFVAAMIALCNEPFVYVWTHGRISWDPLNDALLGILLVVYSVNRCHGGFVGVTKKIEGARYIYFAEGVVFVAMAFFVSGKWGFPGIISCAILADILLPGIYGLWRSKRFFGCSYREMTFGWLISPGLYALSLLLPIFTLFTIFKNPSAQSLFLRGGLLVVVGLPLLWILGIPSELRLEIRGKLAAFFTRKTTNRANKTPVKAGSSQSSIPL